MFRYCEICNDAASSFLLVSSEISKIVFEISKIVFENTFYKIVFETQPAYASQMLHLHVLVSY